ncbi:hypothetical protein Rumeso_04991 [Rubellimicrobium mesophilum DSM 19309]|uniref:Uncharacterized protein n=1 Tax=Rubellimicrobium mesophilum DSM 19309 TaxID=442562 RepID=A0A017HBB8_9RHOB|nr:hypothetical protein [Rubellimicrobium mesophilum]EYD71590.1 hypothetical protein Rumeso_04991 [Rubellimicrobium mesophilum DSM 19309]
MRDLSRNIKTALALAPAVLTATANGVAIDLKGANGVAFVVNTGALAGSAIFAAKVQESDDGSTFADVVDTTLVDSNAPATLAASSTYKLGYRGFKRYARVVLTYTSGTSLAAGASAVLNVGDLPVA